MRRSFLLCLALGLVSVSCASSRPPALVAQVQPGHAGDTMPRRILMLDASCGSAEARCPREYVATVNEIVRSAFELSGYTIIASDELRNVTRQRSETHESTIETHEAASSTRVAKSFARDEDIDHRGVSRSTTEKTTIVLDGPGFDDLDVTERRQVLADAGTDAVASVRIVVGGRDVWNRSQNVEVTIRLGVDHGDRLAWASRCLARSEDFSTVSRALEQAARCAVHGGTLR